MPVWIASSDGHASFEETIYGLEGTATWTIDGETVAVGPGEAVCVRRGQIHRFENHGSIDAKFLAIATPAVFGPAYFARSVRPSPPPLAVRPIWPRSVR